MQKFLLAFAILAIVTLSANAQTTFIVTSSITGAQYTSTVRPAGVNTLLTFWATSGNFSPTSSGAVSAPNCDPSNEFDISDCQGNGIVIEGRDSSNNFLGYAVLSYVSSGQVNGYWKSTTNTDATKATTWRYKKDSGGGNFVVLGTASPTPQTVERFNVQPFLVTTTLGGVTGQYLTGTLWGCTSTATPCPGYGYMKSLTDGTANPTTYNGKATLVQFRITGFNGEDIADINNQSFLALGSRTTLTDITNCDQTFYVSDGIYDVNAIWLPGIGTNWFGGGHQDLYVSYVGSSGGTFGYRQGPWNAAGDRPHGLVYFQ